MNKIKQWLSKGKSSLKGGNVNSVYLWVGVIVAVALITFALTYAIIGAQNNPLPVNTNNGQQMQGGPHGGMGHDQMNQDGFGGPGGGHGGRGGFDGHGGPGGRGDHGGGFGWLLTIGVLLFAGIGALWYIKKRKETVVTSEAPAIEEVATEEATEEAPEEATEEASVEGTEADANKEDDNK